MIGYVAKLDHRCSPSEMIGDPVASNFSIESRAAASLQEAYAHYDRGEISKDELAEQQDAGLGREPTGSVGIPVLVRGS